MYKKIIPIFTLCVAMVLPMVAFTGCSKEESKKKEIPNTTTQSNALETTVVEEVIEKETIPLSTMEEQILLDYNGIKITGVELIKDPILGMGMELLIENNSTENLGIQCDAVIVNNYMIGDLFAADVPSGKKVTSILYFSSQELKVAGITHIEELELYFHIFNSQNYETIYNSERILVQTSAHDSIAVPPNQDGVELYFDQGIRILANYVEEDAFGSNAILLYIENHMDKNIGIQCESLAVNGKKIKPFFSSTVYANKKLIDDISLTSSDLKKKEITSIEEITLSFKIFDPITHETLMITEPMSFLANH